jgi:protein-histidine N-methyltransferase
VHSPVATEVSLHVTVLELVTLPNLLLAYCAAKNTDVPEEGELELTEDLLDSFQADVAARGIDLRFFHGDWSTCDIGPQLRQEAYTICLTSETVYNKANLPALCRLLHGCSTRGPSSLCLVAAKRLYFGLDGGEAEFIAEVSKLHGSTKELSWPDRPSAGVGRVVLQVQFG